MTKTKTKAKAAARHSSSQDMDGVYLLKLALYVIFGSLWLKAGNGDTVSISLPLGFAFGILFASHDHFRIDRKIEYAVLMIAMLVGYFVPYGIYINF